MKSFAQLSFPQLISAAALGLTLLAPVAQAADQDMKTIMQKGHEKMMSMPMSGKPDVDFAMMMRQHHADAVEMAQWQLDHGKDPKIKEMARKIISDQKKEIAQFDQFLAQNGQKPSTAEMGASGKSQGQHHGDSQSK